MIFRQSIVRRLVMASLMGVVCSGCDALVDPIAAASDADPVEGASDVRQAELSVVGPAAATLVPGTFISLDWTVVDVPPDCRILLELVNSTDYSTWPVLSEDGLGDGFSIDSNPTGGTLLIPTETPAGHYWIEARVECPQELPTVYVQSNQDNERLDVTVVIPGDHGLLPPVPPAVSISATGEEQPDGSGIKVRITVEVFADPSIWERFDESSNPNLYVLLDGNLDPNDEDPAHPAADKIVLLASMELSGCGLGGPLVFHHWIHPDMLADELKSGPLYVRATVDDHFNPRAHEYAELVLQFGP